MPSVAPAYKRGWLTLAIITTLLLPLLQAQVTGNADAAAASDVAPTGFSLAAQFANFYARQGGLAVLGYPVSEPRLEGKYLVQWTERQRLEWHPENAGTEYEVLLGLLGRELTRGLDGPSFSRSTPQSVTGAGGVASIYFPETGKEVAEPFATYWRQHGGLRLFGYPVSERFTNQRGLQVQWFERARFEYHPENAQPHQVLLGHLGLEARVRIRLPRYEISVGGNASQPSPLRVELAQGGESDDPDFLANVRFAASELGPGLVRVDNIYNFYGIVQYEPSGAVRYDWAKFDRALDSIISMGKTPLICLSYMPETMARGGSSRIMPPADYARWADLVRATVHHVNVVRALGVKYWEVWNEPNEWSFWQGSYPDYLRLYDVTVEAALAADPNIKLGGPSISRFSAGHLQEFLAHQQGRGPLGRADFVSWHSYGQSPADLAADIRSVRSIVAEYPQFRPELFITEFNVLQGEGDTSAFARTDRVVGAIALLSSIEAMEREGLDRAFLFELKDGPGPSRFWGRWGILTHDATRKPIYHALRAYKQRPPDPLPVTLRTGDAANGTVGLMAYRGAGSGLLLLWYTGADTAEVKVSLPPELSTMQFDLLLFDERTNNPAGTGRADLAGGPTLQGGDIRLDLQPNSLVILTSR